MKCLDLSALIADEIWELFRASSKKYQQHHCLWMLWLGVVFLIKKNCSGDKTQYSWQLESAAVFRALSILTFYFSWNFKDVFHFYDGIANEFMDHSIECDGD